MNAKELLHINAGLLATDPANCSAGDLRRLIVHHKMLLDEVEREYTELADIHNNWPGRDTMAGQAKLCRLRDLIAKATGRDPQDVQDDYGTRIALAKATGQEGGTA